MHPRKQHNPNRGKRHIASHAKAHGRKPRAAVTGFYPGTNGLDHYIRLYENRKISRELFATAVEHFRGKLG